MKKMEKQLPLAPRWADFPDIELYMDQVISVLERQLTPYFPEEKCITSTMINNYVKQKLLPPPQNKRYSKEQLSRLFMICVLKSFLQLSELSALLDELSHSEEPQALYSLFADMLDEAVRCVFCGTQAPAVPQDPTKRALRGALMAFASILYARLLFRQALATWEPPISPEEQKEMDKEAKKEAKEKEKKEAKEKKDKKEKKKE